MKKFVMLALLLLLLALAACTGNGGSGQPGTSTVDETEIVNITFHYIWGGRVFDPEWTAWQQAMEETGVFLEGTANPLFNTAGEEFNLQAALGFPAHLYAGTHASGFMQFGMEGAFIPLNNLLPTYAPAFYDLMTRFPEIRAAITAPDGNIYHLPGLNDIFETVASGRNYWIRQDWLDALSLDVPDTLAELEHALFAFRDYMPALTGNDVVFPVMAPDQTNLLQRLVPLWGARFQGNNNGARIAPAADGVTLYHTFLTPEFKYAIQNISRWYQEGIIDPQVFTRGGQYRQELFTSNQGAFLYHYPLSTGDFNAIMREFHPTFNLVAIKPPINPNGERVSEHQRIPVNNNGWAISHTNPHPERTLQFIDFHYTRRGRTLQSFGPEGIAFEYDANGNPVFLPRVWEQGMPTIEYIRSIHGAVQDGIGRWPDITFEHQLGGPETYDAFILYEAHGSFAPRMLPLMSFTLEERDEIAAITPLLNSHLNEYIQRFILEDWNGIAGQWDAFVAAANALGAQELVELHQAAFDRFNAGR